jgi:methionyl aminopeptidase
LCEGDIISIDVGIVKNDYWGDTAYTYRVGKVSAEVDKLCRITEESLYLGIKEALPNARLNNISHAVQSHAEKNGFTVVKEFVGHGIGRNLWEKPKVPNYGQRGLGPRLQPGLCIAIEPMINMGTEAIKILSDGWTVETRDKMPSAHYEHTIAITEDGPEILSKI